MFSLLAIVNSVVDMKIKKKMLDMDMDLNDIPYKDCIICFS